MKQTILVTGYGGFLGTAICRELLAHGYRVRGMARQHYSQLADAGVQCLQADATDSAACQRACQNVDAIIHTAALAGVWGPASIYVSANILTTSNLLAAARENSVSAMVLSSSPSVTFGGTAQVNVDESVPYPARWLCHYSHTKAIAEELVLASNDVRHLATCALRPHLIWGVGDPHLIPRLIDRCRRGRLRRVGDGKNLIDTVHVDHAAIAHRLAVERLLAKDTGVAGRPFFITDAQPVECWEWIRFLIESAGLRAPQKSISFKNAYRLGAVLEQVYRILGKQTEPPMTRFVAAQLGVAHHFDIDSARKRLCYVPITDREERLRELRRWIAERFV